MQDFDHGFKELSRRAGRDLARMADVPCDRWTPIVSEVQTTERFADRAFRARRNRERFVVYFEAYTRWNRHAPWNVLSKAALLSERERLPTLPILFILQPRGYQPQGGQFRLEVGGELTQQVCFREVRLWAQPAEQWESVAALLPLYPLCHHGLPVRDAVLHAAGAIRERIHGSTEQADALFLLSIFGFLADRRLDAAALIGREAMMESPVYREAVESGRREDRKQAVLEVLEARFGADAVRSMADTVNALEDLEHLHSLHGVALHCTDLPEFRRAAATPPARPARSRRRR